MRDIRPENLANIRARAQELVIGWLNGTASDQPADALRVELLGGDGDITLCFCLGTFCWPNSPQVAQA